MFRANPHAKDVHQRGPQVEFIPRSAASQLQLVPPPSKKKETAWRAVTVPLAACSCRAKVSWERLSAWKWCPNAWGRVAKRGFQGRQEGSFS